MPNYPGRYRASSPKYALYLHNYILMLSSECLKR